MWKPLPWILAGIHGCSTPLTRFWPTWTGWWCNNRLEKWWSESQWVSDDIPYMKWKIKAMFETTNQFSVVDWTHHFVVAKIEKTAEELAPAHKVPASLEQSWLSLPGVHWFPDHLGTPLQNQGYFSVSAGCNSWWLATYWNAPPSRPVSWSPHEVCHTRRLQ